MRVTDPSPAEPQAFWAEHWARQLEENGANISWDGDSPEDLNNTGIRMLTNPDVLATINAIEPLLDPAPVVEKKISLQVPGVPIPIIGYIDVIEADGIPADFKTSSRSWGSQKAQEEMQPCFYLAALNQMGHKSEWPLDFRHYVFVKTKVPKVEIWRTQRRSGELFWLFGAIRDVWQAIEARAFPPNPGTWLCSPKYCEFWDLCRGKM